jgi:hypothetical protein
MRRGEKRLEELRANPAGDWQIKDIGLVCRAYGIELRAPRSGGSHYKVTHQSQHEILTVPAGRPIKPVYIRRFVQFVDAVKEAQR